MGLLEEQSTNRELFTNGVMGSVDREVVRRHPDGNCRFPDKWPQKALAACQPK